MFENWEELKENCLNCRKCSLCEVRSNVVFGVGNPCATVMFIGEGPGRNEDLQGEPFVGAGGQLLDKYLAAVDLDRRTNIYIANIVKCRPPQNRDPLQEEQEACMDWLRNQTALLRPKIIVCLGRIAAMRIIKPDFKITREHGQFFKKGNIYMTATLHPAALLRNPAQKPAAFDDFLKLRDKIDELQADISKTYKTYKAAPILRGTAFFVLIINLHEPYSSFARSASPLSGWRYAGATSKTVLQPT